MPSLSASDYTTYVKNKAAYLAYQNNQVPLQIQRTYQPYATKAALNSMLTASQASLATSSTSATLPMSKLGRVVPYPGVGYVNNPRNLSTVSTSGAGTLPVAPNSKDYGRTPGPGRPHVA